MSDCEWIAQVPHVKKATVSDALRSLMINEQMSEALVFLSESLICSFAHKKRAIWSKNLPKIVFLERFLKFFYKTSDLLIPSGHLPKMSDVSESLRSITKNEQMSEWSNRSFFERIANSLIICSLFRKKRAIHSRKPKSKFPTLRVT